MLALLVITLVGGVALIGAGALGYRRVLAVWHDRAARHFVYPPNTLVYTDDPAEVAAYSGGQTFGPGWTTLTNTAGAAVQWSAQPAQERAAMVNGEAFCGGPVLFMHGLTGPQGQRRVVIEMVSAYRSMAPQLGVTFPPPYLQIRVCRPTALWRGGAMLKWHLLFVPGLGREACPDALRVYGGAADASDPAAFSIPCQSGGVRHVITGRLMANDTLECRFDGQLMYDQP